MSWIASLGIAIITSLLTLLGAGSVAALAVEWYHVSSFEGGSGFFVIGMALCGGLAGFVIGLVASRVTAARPRPSFLKALGTSAGVVSLLLVIAAGVSWALADIPPRIDGDELFLLAEVRWPAAGAVPPAEMKGVPFLRLGALRGSVARRLERGPFFVEDARQEDGRWIVTGAAPIFTSRGGRVLDFGFGDKTTTGFIVPLPAYPGEAQRQWSAWYPAARPGQPALPDQFTYRFKVIRTSEALRTESIGPFEVDTVADYFYYVAEDSRLAAHATFRLRYHGKPIAELPEVETVATVGGPTAALFVTTDRTDDGNPCALLVDDRGTLRVQKVNGCGAPATERLLTSDPARFAAARLHGRLPGWIDRGSFVEPGLFQLDAAVIDTRALTAAQVQFPSETRPDNGVPPLDLSPDERSFVWFVQGDDDTPRLGVTNWRTSESYILPIDRARMRYNTPASLDPNWVRHHFVWTPGPSGADVLAERPGFVPLPHHGDLTLGKPGEYQSYTLRPAGEPLRAALIDLLVRDVGGERLPDEPGGYRQQVRVNGKIVAVSVATSPPYVDVSMDGADSDPQAMSALAAKLDAALATGAYDALFVAPKESQ